MSGVSIEVLRRQALASGAELEIEGAIFNSGKVKMQLAPKVVALPVEIAPALIASPALTIEDVTEILAERDAAWREQITQMTQAFMAALKALQPVAPVEGKPAKVVKFKVTYDRAGNTEDIIPIYEQQNTKP